ncbi:MAG: hypothetical protein HQM10_09945 [Candidatus Riflebacteria bacterium]|nr:hypothetical protein [Candidatus Riflebacteria bacterium]
MNKGKFIYTRIFLLFFAISILSCTNLYAAGETPQAVKSGFQNLGKAILTGIAKVLDVMNNLGKTNFHAKVEQSSFLPDGKKMRILITGSVSMKAKTMKHGVIKRFSSETPLPDRKECIGFLKMNFPQNLESVDQNQVLSSTFNLDIEVNLEACLKISVLTLAGAGINSAISKVPDFCPANVEKIAPKNVQLILEKFFPKVIEFLTGRSTSIAFDEFITLGQIQSRKFLSAIGIDEILGFTFNLSAGLAKDAATAAIKGGMIAAAGSAALATPLIGNFAIGALMVVVADRVANVVLDVGLFIYEKGRYRDRFTKIDWFFKGQYPAGVWDTEWLEKQVSKEVKSESFKTIQELIFFLKRLPPENRNNWKSLIDKVKSPLKFKIQQDNSWGSEKFLGMLEILFEK